MSSSKRRPSVADNYRSKSPKSGLSRWLILLVIGVSIVAFIYSSIPKSKPPVGPQFTKEGEVNITRAGKEIAHLDVEIADTPEDIQQGLMYRRSMDEDRGMLFLLPDNDIQSFWMLNTYIPLDIIFVGADKRIVNIAANAKPHNIDPVSSTAPAHYVLEVNAGYGQRKGLKAGDLLEW